MVGGISALIGAALLGSRIGKFKKDETGVSSIVATVLLILIVVLLAALFWDKISQWFNDTWEKILGQSDTIG